MLIDVVLMISQVCKDLIKVVQVYVIKDEVLYDFFVIFFTNNSTNRNNENGAMLEKVPFRFRIN